MASTSKSANPAPDYTVLMNRVQSQFESQISSIRSMLPPRTSNSTNPSTNPPNSSATTTTSTFSSLTSTPTTTSNPTTSQNLARAKAESLFTESSADPNTGLGFGTSAKPSHKERENQALRNRLIGRGRQTNKQGGIGTGRDKESSDEEEGRSALGRSKKRRRVVDDAETRPGDGEAENMAGTGVVEETTDEPETQSDKVSNQVDNEAETRGDEPIISENLARSKAAQKKSRKRKRAKEQKRREKEVAASGAATG
ncbi:hypothetical protein GGR57DRAFT_370491 [Xylariaceae sp. FL1272]|nr:hypothetical protein GGR57DRAFT_370491 [Xylariaceae sp. FL1272]